MTISEILEMPYNLYQDLILKQIDMRKKEDKRKNETMNKMKNKSYSGPIYFPDED